jgi:hypothetical protein
VGRVGMFPDAPGRVPGTLLEIGNLGHPGACAPSRQPHVRDHESWTALDRCGFGSARDARRYMIMDLCGSFRFHTRAAPMVMKELAPGTELEEVPRGYRLSWPAGEATSDLLASGASGHALDSRRRP